MESANLMRNALTVDVEDYFHVAAFSQQIDPANRDQFPLRVERNTHRLLDLFAERDVRATFFVLGWVAERCPNLVRAIADHISPAALDQIFTFWARNPRSE